MKNYEEDSPSLGDLPNIGDELAKSLREAGISSPEELKKVGSVDAAIRMSPHRRSGPACRNALGALEGLP